jgi:Sec-independent protein secretion pathway component TatC
LAIYQTRAEHRRKEGSQWCCILCKLTIWIGCFIWLLHYRAIFDPFLAGFQVSEMISNQITIDSYLSSVVTLTLCTGIVFELPMLALILSKLGLLTPQLMRSSRRYAIVIMLVIAAIVTPTPDAQTMLIVTFPLLLLYEISIVVSNRVEKRRNL